jgi:hypothetical protein
MYDFNYEEYKAEAIQNKNVIKLNAKKKNLPNKPPTKLKRKGDGKTTPTGTAFPNINTSFTRNRYGIEELKQVLRVAPIARSVWQLQLISFKYFNFKVVPPYKQELDENVVSQLEPKMEEIDRKINTTLCCSQALYDLMTFGSAIFEIVWGNDNDGWVVPITVQRLPAESFKTAPVAATGNKKRYQTGVLLKGIVLDKEDNSYHYYQMQDETSGVPVEIPSENIIHIKDRNSTYVDGEPYLAGIVSTISQLEFVRKRMMQAAQRCGTPTMKVQVGIPKEYIDADIANGGQGLTGALPGENVTYLDDMLTQLWGVGCAIGEQQSADIAVVTPKGVDVDWQRPSIPINPTEFDQYLIKEAISHIFPRDALDVLSTSMSTTNPLLELLKNMVEGWQQLCATPFENDLWTKFVLVNGFEGYRIELDWAPPVPENQEEKNRIALEQLNAHVISLNEYRAKVGEPPLDDPKEGLINKDTGEPMTMREQIYDEMLRYKVPQSMMPQPAMPGMPPGASGAPGEAGTELGAEAGPEAGTEAGSEEVPATGDESDATLAEGDALLKELEAMGLGGE